MVRRVIHFGWDDCYRVAVLKAAGFDVKDTKSFDQLIDAFQSKTHWGALIISENPEQSAECAAYIARRTSKTPVVLFRCSSLELPRERFDRVYCCLTRPEVWLPDLFGLIVRNYARGHVTASAGAPRNHSRMLADRLPVWSRVQTVAPIRPYRLIPGARET